jgi:hypothetical protein
MEIRLPCDELADETKLKSADLGRLGIWWLLARHETLFKPPEHVR